MGQELQAVLLAYLRVVLTEWEEPYKEKAELLMGRVSNKKAILELFTKLLISKVRTYVIFWPLFWLLTPRRSRSNIPPPSPTLY